MTDHVTVPSVDMDIRAELVRLVLTVSVTVGHGMKEVRYHMKLGPEHVRMRAQRRQTIHRNRKEARGYNMNQGQETRKR